MKDAIAISIELESAKSELLQEMARKCSLADAGRVVRCLINYTREHPEAHADIFSEVRCADC